MSYFHVFFEKDHISFSNKIIFSGKKKYNLSRQYNKKDYIPVRFFWKDHLFRLFEENIIFPCIFLER